MATSESYDFSVSESDIIQSALRKIGALQQGETLDDADYSDARTALNLIVKQWMGKSDFAPSLKVWTRKRGFLFLQSSQHEYTLGPASTADHATDSYIETTISATEASGQTVLSVADSTGMAAADNVGILLDSGTIQWTTIVTVDSAIQITVTDALTGQAGAGAAVYAYTNKIQKPLKILTMVRRNSNGDDSPMDPIDLDQYESLPDKNATGNPNVYLYEERATDGLLFIDTDPTDLTDVLRFVFLRPLQDFDSSGNTADFPAQWFRALIYQLAIDMAPEYGEPVTAELKTLRDESLLIAQSDNPENSTVFFEPGRY